VIYYAEDDAGIRELVVYTLRSTGFPALGVADGQSLWKAIDREIPKLILLDIMLPGEDGVSILKRLKTSPTLRHIPVIMATAKSAEYDKVIGLDLGADDYLAKPFGMMEMVSRIKAVLRRVEAADGEKTLDVGALHLDTIRHEVTACGKVVTLTMKEFTLLQTLMERPGQVFTRDQLLSDIWGYDFDGETRTVDVHIRTLRQKLGECGEMIETVRGMGYRLGERL
jgi:two-component system alkaline phosphatase synthesis response regulator PhoP